MATPGQEKCQMLLTLNPLTYTKWILSNDYFSELELLNLQKLEYLNKNNFCKLSFTITVRCD